ncbi:hypothetical protein [Leptospira kmetyi]|uniref:hypothetical protein n=1 Tax=Leptospira kmetyi TaxID=408139 RepID=UPI003EBF8BB4
MQNSFSFEKEKSGRTQTRRLSKAGSQFPAFFKGRSMRKVVLRAFVSISFFVSHSVFTNPLFAVESRIGFTMETYESRYSHSAKENWFFKTANCDSKREPQSRSENANFLPIRTNSIPAAPNRFCASGFFETRNGTPLLSAKVDHRFFRASFGHRFRPLENFYFLRDNDFYTALPEIDQAIHRAGFFGFKHGDWSLGTYYSEQEAKRKPGFYLLSPRKLFEIAFSPESKKHYVSLNFQSKNFRLPGPKIVSRIQTLGEKKEFDGTFYSSLISERLDSEFRITGYRGKSEDLFSLDPDRKELKGKAELARFAITSHSAFSIEWIRAWNRPIHNESKIFDFNNVIGVAEAFLSNENSSQSSPSNSVSNPNSKRWEIIAGKAPIVYDPIFGGILFSLRNYTNETLGRGIYYGLYQKRFTIEAGQEWRINGDAISEGKWSFRLNEVWNLEGAFLFQKEGNRTDSLFEARTARDETSLIFTDRSSSFRLRLLSPYVAFSVSHSRRKEHKTDGIWINLQVQFPF